MCPGGLGCIRLERSLTNPARETNSKPQLGCHSGNLPREQLISFSFRPLFVISLRFRWGRHFTQNSGHIPFKFYYSVIAGNSNRCFPLREGASQACVRRAPGLEGVCGHRWVRAQVGRWRWSVWLDAYFPWCACPSRLVIPKEEEAPWRRQSPTCLI